MTFSESLAARIRGALARKKGVEEKKVFGGVGFLLNGNLLVGVWKESLVVRLGPDEGEEALNEPHVKEFDITGRATKGSRWLRAMLVQAAWAASRTKGTYVAAQFRHL